MKVTREELLQQRATLQPHLQWIDSKLAQFEEPANEPKLTLDSKGVSNSAPVVHPTAPEQPSGERIASQDDTLLTPDAYQGFAPSDASSAGVTFMQKFGCVAVAIIFCLGFVGFLFGPWILSLISEK